MNLSDIKDPALRARILKARGEQGGGVAEHGATPAEATYKDEAELQTICERILERADFWRLTERNILAHGFPRGWWLHINDARRECCISDLVVFNQDMTRCLCVELKATEKSKVRKAQKQMITTRRWRIAFNADQFAGHLAAWIGEGGK